ncbi:MAG: hypothetical protein Q8S94_17155 [Pseudohongiella sp.]|nr:hypothetical protein [Pseudohongiella sp.]
MRQISLHQNTSLKRFIVTSLTLGLTVAATSAFSQYEAPRLPNGQPDLQGVWSNKTLTPLTRDRALGDARQLTTEQVAAKEGAQAAFVEAEYAPSDPNREAGAGAQGGNDGNTEDGYNEFWKEEGDRIQMINGEYRSSIIIEPANGQIPFIPDRSLRRRLPEGLSANDGPEGRPLAERCLLSFGNHSGPPMLPVMYNNNYQIVQNDDYVMIMAEMNHDARIIKLNDEVDLHMQKWMGDSVGRWEGDTLVVTTAGFHPQQLVFGASQNLTITERFTRTAESEILYAFTVDDPTVYTEAWTGELMFNARPADEKIFEYACHEGNYALPGVLAGARMLELEAAQ